jgi:hypothetical protein
MSHEHAFGRVSQCGCVRWAQRFEAFETTGTSMRHNTSV